MANVRKRARWLATILVIVASSLGWGAESSVETVEFEAALAALNARSFDDKLAAAEQVAAIENSRTVVVLKAFLDGALYTLRGEDTIVIGTRIEGGYSVVDAASGAGLADVGRRGVRKINVNNALRRALRGLIATLELDQPDPDDRIAAVDAIAEAAEPETRALLVDRLDVEQDADVLEAIRVALVVFDLESPDDGMRLDAVRAAADNLNGRVRIVLTNIANDENELAEIRTAANESLATIDATVQRFRTVETLLFGLSLGSILVLAAIGLSITFGVMGVINMAHGELIMIGAYTTYVVQILFPDAIAYSLLIAVPSAFVVSGLVGIAIERGIIRFLYGRPLETLLATFGVSLVLQQAVRSVFSPLNRSVTTPEWMSGSLELAQGLSITTNRLYILIFTGFVFALLWLVLNKTRLGLEVRAVTQNRAMARAMGIRSARVDVLTFGLGAGIAGVAGVALSQLTNVGPNLGQGYIVDSFMVVVFGGVGNLWGTLVAGLSLGVVNKVIEPWAGAVVAKILVLVFIILFIQIRPRGLFPQKGRAAE